MEAEPIEAATEVPDWLQELQPPVEDEPEEQELEESVAEAATEEEPAEEIVEEPVAEATTVTTEEELAPEEPAEEEEFFGWSGFEVEETRPQPEPEEAEEEKTITSFGFTGFETEEGEEETPAEEPQQEIETVTEKEEAAVEETPEPPVEEELPEPAPTKLEEAEEVHEAPQTPVAEPPPAVEEEAEPAGEDTTLDLEERSAYVETNESDYEARLELARALWSTGDVNEAIEHYVRLIRTSDLLDQVIDDLESYTEQAPEDPRPLQTLGDAYMKDGELDRALQAYKRAMNLF